MSEELATGDWSGAAGRGPADWPTVPGYEILGELGRGGMGVVYRARQLSLQRLVALKLIRDGALAGPEDRARFRVEAQAAARMHHPNIIQVYDVGEHEGRPYFAMELVEGGSLDQRLAGRPQPAAQSAELVRTLALAVAHAHAQQIVHRDLKPANVLIADCRLRIADCQASAPAGPTAIGNPESAPAFVNQSAIHNPQSAIPKITDFGLAKRLDSDSTALTHDGAVLGTASYMAPEQAAGRTRDIGPAADVYALGAMLYECLTGRPPFLADSWQETIEQVLHDEPAPPTRRCADVPRDLETVCLKCLEKEPRRRYPGATELADDLGRFLQGKPVAAVALGAIERLARLAARDGYQLVGEIGRGPGSVVYRALSGALNQPVALKVFTAGTCTKDEWDARLRRDAECRAGLAHPQIVPIQQAGWWDGAPYLAVEYVQHGSLSTRFAGQRSAIREALRLVEQVAEVVSYLHRQGVVHGNLKPSNILLAADGIPRLTDFRPTSGLLQVPLSAAADPTALGGLAPELLRDPSAEPRPYTDIYGLGVILYALVTARLPCAGASAAETLDQVRSQDPPAPSRHNAQVTPELDECCLRCLRKNPWRRYARAYDLATHLRSLRLDMEGRPPPRERRPRRRPPERGRPMSGEH